MNDNQRMIGGKELLERLGIKFPESEVIFYESTPSCSTRGSYSIKGLANRIKALEENNSTGYMIE